MADGNAPTLNLPPGKKTRPSWKADIPLHAAVADAQGGFSEDKYVPCRNQNGETQSQLYIFTLCDVEFDFESEFDLELDFDFAACYLQLAVCGLQIAACSLRFVFCILEFAV